MNYGRAGDKARLRIDSQDAFCVNNNFNNNQNSMLKKIRLDEKDFEVAEEVAAKLDSSAAKISDLESTNKELKSRMDSIQGECDGLKSKVEALSKQDHSQIINEQVKSKISLISKAKQILKSDEDFIGLSEREIKSKVISAIQPEAKFDEKSDEYVSARFDTILEFQSNEKLAKHFAVASNKSDSDENQDLDLSHESLQAKLINSKGE